MISIIADIMGWHMETHWSHDCPKDEWGAVRHLEENWKRFCRGDHSQARTELMAKKQNKKFRKDRTYDMDEV